MPLPIKERYYPSSEPAQGVRASPSSLFLARGARRQTHLDSGTRYRHSEQASPDTEAHRRLRRTQAYAFSERAVSQQEVCLQQYTAFFINRLFESRHNSPSGIIDLAQWINLLTTDIAGDLTLGESFRGLEDGKIHPWLRNIQWTTKVFAFIRESSRYPGVLRAIGACCSRNKEDKQESFIARAVAKRFDMGTDRPDLMSCIIEAASEGRSVYIRSACFIELFANDTIAYLKMRWRPLLLPFSSPEARPVRRCSCS
ncbi:isotrichodermin C-15 hydroxylase [Ilyonectria robusta]